jgi:hypothetical protein
MPNEGTLVIGLDGDGDGKPRRLEPREVQAEDKVGKKVAIITTAIENGGEKGGEGENGGKGKDVITCLKQAPILCSRYRKYLFDRTYRKYSIARKNEVSIRSLTKKFPEKPAKLWTTVLGKRPTVGDVLSTTKNRRGVLHPRLVEALSVNAE